MAHIPSKDDPEWIDLDLVAGLRRQDRELVARSIRAGAPYGEDARHLLARYFEDTGDYWRLVFKGKPGRQPDNLAMLLSSPVDDTRLKRFRAVCLAELRKREMVNYDSIVQEITDTFEVSQRTAEYIVAEAAERIAQQDAAPRPSDPWPDQLD